MAKIDARACDSCGDVYPQSEMTVRTTRFEGPVLNGSYDEDICASCLGTPPAGVTLKPLRKKRGQAAEEPVAPTPEPEADVDDLPMDDLPMVADEYAPVSDAT